MFFLLLCVRSSTMRRCDWPDSSIRCQIPIRDLSGATTKRTYITVLSLPPLSFFLRFEKKLRFQKRTEKKRKDGNYTETVLEETRTDESQRGKIDQFCVGRNYYCLLIKPRGIKGMSRKSQIIDHQYTLKLHLKLHAYFDVWKVILFYVKFI